MSIQSKEASLARGAEPRSRVRISPRGNGVQRGTRSYTVPLPPAGVNSILSEIGVHQSIDAHQLVFCEGDAADNYFCVHDGIVRSDKVLVDGRRQVLGLFFPGDHFGFSLSGEYEYSAEAANACNIIRYKRSQLEALFDQNPLVAHRLVATMESEIRAARERSLILGCRSPVERFTTFLLMLAERLDRKEGAPVQLDMTREEIGDYLGLCMETVSRCISRLRDDRIIELASPHQIVIVDRNGLEGLANPAIFEAL